MCMDVYLIANNQSNENMKYSWSWSTAASSTDYSTASWICIFIF